MKTTFIGFICICAAVSLDAASFTLQTAKFELVELDASGTLHFGLYVGKPSDRSAAIPPPFYDLLPVNTANSLNDIGTIYSADASNPEFANFTQELFHPTYPDTSLTLYSPGKNFAFFTAPLFGPYPSYIKVVGYELEVTDFDSWLLHSPPDPSFMFAHGWFDFRVLGEHISVPEISSTAPLLMLALGVLLKAKRCSAR